MKRWIFYAVLIAAVVIPGGKNSAGMDVGRIQPVQTVRVSCVGGQILIETDTGEQGVGDDLKSAFYNMKDTAAAEVFLDTADYLILTENCEGLLPVLLEYLRPACSVCLEKGTADLEQVGGFLKIHDPGVTLKDCHAGGCRLPVLMNKEGRMELVS